MDHVASRACIFKERCEAASAFGFDRFRTAGFMPFGTRLSLGEQFLLQARHEFRVFAVRGDDHSEALCEFERLVHFGVIDTDEVLVSEKDLERRRSVSNNLSQLRFWFLHKLRYRHVKGILARALAIG